MKIPVGPCIQHEGYVNPHHGYGLVGQRRAHVVAWEAVYGPVPKGLVLDHVCHNVDPDCPGSKCLHRSCINVDHLDLVTSAENIRRGKSPRNVASRNNICLRGLHPLTGGNVVYHANGSRRCKQCLHEVGTKYRAEHRDHLLQKRREWRFRNRDRINAAQNAAYRDKKRKATT